MEHDATRTFCLATKCPKTGRLSRKDQNIYIVIRGMRIPSAIAQMWCEKCVLESESGKPMWIGLSWEYKCREKQCNKKWKLEVFIRMMRI